MRSLRSRLLALWIMLVVSGAATAYLLVKSFQQTSNARVARSEELVARACRDIADRYQSAPTAVFEYFSRTTGTIRADYRCTARHRLDNDIPKALEQGR